MAPQEPKNYGRGALGKLKASFQVVSTTAGTFSPLKAAINELANALDLVEDIAENQESYEELRSELQSTVDSLGPYMDKLDAEARKSSVERIIKSINEQIVQIKKQQEKGKTKQVLGIRENREDLTKRYRQIATLLRQLQSDINLRIWDNTYKQYSEIKLKGLSPVSHAAYNSWYSTVIKRRGCTPGTREPVLKTLREWAQDPHAAKIFWMNGMLGVGKTTIAYSLCEWLENEKQLGASFFCSHSSDDCRSLNGVVPTIAYQLARYSPAFQSALFHALEDDPDAPMRNISTQFEKIIVQPVARVQTALPEGIVVVIDALDECDDRGVPLFELLLRHAVNMPMKFFITSRPESMIRRRILSCQERVAPSMHLDDIEASLVEEDVNTYLAEELGNMPQSPTEVQLRQLAKQSGGLFICASLLPLYINPPTSYVNSSTRLQTILSLEVNLWNGTGPQKLCAPLDLLYHRALDRAFDNMLELEELQNVQDVLWAVICGKKPIRSIQYCMFQKEGGLSLPSIYRSPVSYSASPGQVSPAAFRKLVKEIQQLRAEPLEDIRVVPSEENMLDVVGIVAGPEGTPYAGGYYHIHFSFPATFPASPPSARMLTKIFHPNVSRSGEICVNTLKKDWKPTYGLGHVLVTIKCLLIVPNAESALDEEAGKLLLEDWDEFCARAKMWCSVHATPKVPPVEFQTPAAGKSENATSDEPASSKSKLEVESTPVVQQSPLQPSAAENAACVVPEQIPVKPSLDKSATGTENGGAGTGTGVVKTTAKRVATGGVEKKKKALKRL
ncbi:ubiquitin-conjugating enzyme E2 S [Rhizoctonia solani]|uniref:E2 ubiquitin-conjugating enzyme n=1 Tax=Rhizoctonia solani TaxID=456999 RepID=A0A0K6GAA1_9AGAM|nr:ubiquitin-conjugating enzyme E2 S [Rhizoctonia solani]